MFAGLKSRLPRGVAGQALKPPPHTLWALSAALALWMMADTARGQAYAFRIPEATVTVEILKDGSAAIDYDLLFINEGSPIDVVDIGLPTDDCDISKCRAWLDGKPQTDIRRSTYVEIGIEVHLDPAIQAKSAANDLLRDMLAPDAGAKAPGVRLAVTCLNPRMVYEDTTDESYASFRFTPTWFSSEFLAGTTNLQLRYVLPGSPAKNEIKWQSEPFDMVGRLDETGQAMVVWNRHEYGMTGPHLFGVSFPRRFVDNVIEITAIGLAWTWFTNSPPARLVAGALLLVLFSVGFFLTTRKTGCILWLILAGAGAYLLVLFPWFNGVLLVLGAVLLACGIRIRTRKTGWDYMRAVVSVPGGGLRRGLTAVEAAALLELPVSKILTIMIFGMVKKGILRVTSESPLCVAPAEGSIEPTLQKMREGHVPVYPCEKDALAAIARAAPAGDTDLGEVKFEPVVEKLVESLTKKLAGFDIVETQAYYNKIIARAWKEVEGGPASLRPEVFEASMDWMMLDKEFDKRMGKADLGPAYMPLWLGGWHAPAASAHGPLAGAGIAVPGAGAGGAPLLGVGDVARSIAGKFENIGKSLGASLDLSSVAPKGGIDLSALDKLTSSMLKAAASGSGGGGGGGGGCACACAGCACACACAGGGR